VSRRLSEISQLPYEVYVEEQTLGAILGHCRIQLPLEAIGFLVGNAYEWMHHPYVQIKGFAPGKSRATRVHVEFDDGAMQDVSARLHSRYPGSFLVGWYHSHPGYGCFLSETDIDSQRTYFREPYHVALVVDSSADTIEFFKLDSSSGYRPASFTVIRRHPA
jgi:proteasome lid subunit RPN8/RPN11